MKTRALTDKNVITIKEALNEKYKAIAQRIVKDKTLDAAKYDQDICDLVTVVEALNAVSSYK